jgi:hypothetical protein
MKRLTAEDDKRKDRIIMKNTNDCTTRIAEMKEISFIVIIIEKIK